MEPEESVSDEERRREVRRAYNRLNAQRSRQRTKEKITHLITKVETLQQEESALIENQKKLQLEVKRLKEENEVLRRSAGLTSREGLAVANADVPFFAAKPNASVALRDEPGDESLLMARRLQAEREMALSLLREQSAMSASGISSNPSRSRPFYPDAMLNASHVNALPSLSNQIGSVSAGRSFPINHHPIDLNLPPRMPHHEDLLQQRLMLGMTHAASVPPMLGIEERLLDRHAQSLQDQSGTSVSNPQSLVSGVTTSETSRLLSFLQQRAFAQQQNPREEDNLHNFRRQF